MASPSPRASFQWDDPFQLEGQLTADERAVRDAAQTFAQGELLPKVQEAFRHEKTDAAIFNEMGELGLLGTTIPDRLRRRGHSSYVSYGLVAREIERVDSGYRSMMSVQSSLVMYPIYAYRLEEQKQKYLPKLATGECVGCFGLTEPDARLRSRRHEDPRGEGRRRLPAQRRQDVDHQRADRRRVRGLGEGATTAHIRGFILEKGMTGLSAPKIDGKLSLRASITGEIVMDDVFVPEENLLPERRAACKGPFGCLNSARYGIAWGAMGAAEYCWHARARNTCSTASSSAGRWPPTSSSRRSSPTCRPRSRSACRARCGSAG